METTTLMQQVADDLDKRGFDAEIVPMYKNNIRTQALVVRLEGSSAAPAVYPELLADMAGPDAGIHEISDAVLDFTRQHTMSVPEQALYTDKTYVMGHVQLAACNENWNTERLSDVVHEHVPGTDIAVYPKVIGGEMSVTATNAYLEHMGITPQEIMAQAKTNSRNTYTVRTMQEVMEELYGAPLPMIGDNPMVVISNEAAFNGASAISDTETLGAALQKLESDAMYIIPSSVHEMIAIPADGITSPELSSMIQEVNATSVNEQDRLGDHPYYFDGKALSIVKEETQSKKRMSARSR